MTGSPAAPSPRPITQTHVPPLRHRIFLPQPLALRLASSVWVIAYRLLFRISPRRCNAWRRLVLRIFGADIEHHVNVDRSVLIHHPWNLSVGHHTVIAHEVILNCMGSIHIGADTHISQYAHLCAGTHEYERPDMRIKPCPIHIGDHVWLAADTFVGPCVRIGDRTIVGARTSVFKDLPANVIAVGSPAKLVHERRPSAPDPRTEQS